MKQYSADLRERLLGAIDAGLPLAEAIATALTTITADDAAGWFRHCGYVLPEQLL